MLHKSDYQLPGLCISSLAVFQTHFCKACVISLALSLSLCVSLKAPYLHASSGLSERCSVALNMGNTLKWLYQCFPGRCPASCPPLPPVTSSPWTQGLNIHAGDRPGWLSELQTPHSDIETVPMHGSCSRTLTHNWLHRKPTLSLYGSAQLASEIDIF